MKLKIISRVVTIVLSLIIAGIVFLYLSPDYNMYIVRSESMVPVINMGDVVITGPMDGPFSDDVSEGTIITFERNGETITHRVLSIDNGTITTKGDAVEDPDAFTITNSNIKGVYMFKVPSLGYISKFIQTRVGWFTVIVIPAIVLVVMLFRSISKELKNRSGEKNTAQEKEVMAKPREDLAEKTWKQEKGHYLK